MHTVNNSLKMISEEVASNGTITFCEFNMDTVCIELKFADSSTISIDCIAVENKVAENMYQQSELDYLIYNDLLAIAQTSLNENML